MYCAEQSALAIFRTKGGVRDKGRSGVELEMQLWVRFGWCGR